MKASRYTPRATMGRPRVLSSDGLQDIRKALDDLRSKLAGGERAGSFLEREELVVEVRKLRGEIKSTSANASTLSQRLVDAETSQERIAGLEKKLGRKMDDISGKLDTIDSGLGGLATTENVAQTIPRKRPRRLS